MSKHKKLDAKTMVHAPNASRKRTRLNSITGKK